MTKNSTRLAALTVAVAGALLAPAGTASAAAPSPDARVLDTESANGGDKGFGNCGRNASGGRTVAPLEGAAGNGYGGFKPGDTCVKPAPVLPDLYFDSGDH